MNIVIWGYGLNGKKCRDILIQRFQDVRIICFIDNDRAKINDTSEIPVLPAGVLRILEKGGLIDKIIIPGYDPSVYRSICIQLYELGIEKARSYLFYAENIYFEEKVAVCHTFAEVLKEADMMIPLVGALETEVCEICNLNCKRCNHYSNIFDTGKMMSLELFEKDIKRLSELIYNIKRFKLLGGEPLLNPELYKFVRITRQYFNKTYLAIVTNGILVRQMPQELIDAIKEADAVVEISVYPPVKKIIESVICFLEKNSIKYKIFRDGSQFGSYLNLSGNSDKEYAMSKCYAQVCHAFKNGMVYKCASGQNIHVFNEKYKMHLPEIGIPLHSETMEAKQLYSYLLNTVELCCFCTRFVYHDWEQSRNNTRPEDWIAGEQA